MHDPDESAEVQCRSLCEMQIDIRFHFDATCLPFFGRNDYHASALGCHLVDSFLDCLGVYVLRLKLDYGLALGYNRALQLWHLKWGRDRCVKSYRLLSLRYSYIFLPSNSAPAESKCIWSFCRVASLTSTTWKSGSSR